MDPTEELTSCELSTGSDVDLEANTRMNDLVHAHSAAPQSGNAVAESPRRHRRDAPGFQSANLYLLGSCVKPVRLIHDAPIPTLRLDHATEPI